MSLLPFGGVPPKTNVGGSGITVLNSGSTSTISVTGAGIGSLNYAQAYFPAATSWTTTSATYADPTISGSDTLTIRKSAGITLTAASSNLPGITFTPASASSVYMITASFSAYNSGAGFTNNYQMTDGTTAITQNGSYEQDALSASVVCPISMSGIYAPATTSPVTVKIQVAANAGGTGFIASSPLGSSLEWTVVEIDSLVVNTVSSINGLIGSLTIAGGTNTTVTASGTTITIGPTDNLNLATARGYALP